MLFDWFNAREAVAVGASLADHFLSASRPDTSGRRKSGAIGEGRAALQKFSQRVTHEAGALKLNLFTRARLLNSFKWRLQEHGYDQDTADELTRHLLMQLCADPAAAKVAAGPSALTSRKGRSLTRIPSLLEEVAARLANGQYAEAIEHLQAVLTIDPNHALAHNQLGAALLRLGSYVEAEQEYRRAIELKPSFASAYINLGSLLCRKGDFAPAETALRRAVKLDPKNADALVSLGLTIASQARLGDARICFEKALRLSPRSASALHSLGWLASIEGRFDEAERFYRGALEADAKHAYAWASIADLRRMAPADREWVEGVQRLVESGVSPLEEANLRFALGKYFDDVRKASEAFAQYRRANELKRPLARPYDRAERAALVEDMIKAYTPERLARPAEGASDSPKPVFVIGMMRSGTSLVEQIIASHPQAAGAGELDFWNEIAHKRHVDLRKRPPDAALATKLANEYLRVLSRHSQSAQKVVDKSTWNTDFVGLIHTVLPAARFIYVQRDPIDTCLSCYFQNFANAASFTMDLSDLAHFYRTHHRLIAHWRSVLPAGTLLDVPYAELVADQETWSRRIVEFIGLEWDARCLEFHKVERPVLTASHWQVRQPVYSSSVGRWQNYRKFIGPLLELRDLSP